MTNKIEQIYICELLRPGFEKRLLGNLPLRPYHDPEKPAFFYGGFPGDVIDVLKRHSARKIIIWAGGDINIHHPKHYRREELLKNIDVIRGLKNVSYVARSNFIQKDMEELGLPCTFVPINGIKQDRYQTVKKGKRIYVYTDLHVPGYYGADLYEQIFKLFPGIDFVKMTHPNNRSLLPQYPDWNTTDSEEELIERYAQCYLGLRLTVHDGIAWTVQELGCMGIPCIYNGNSPSAINYRNLNDIARIIERESAKIGTCDFGLSARVKDYLRFRPEWLEEDYYR